MTSGGQSVNNNINHATITTATSDTTNTTNNDDNNDNEMVHQHYPSVVPALSFLLTTPKKNESESTYQYTTPPPSSTTIATTTSQYEQQQQQHDLFQSNAVVHDVDNNDNCRILPSTAIIQNTMTPTITNTHTKTNRHSSNNHHHRMGDDRDNNNTDTDTIDSNHQTTKRYKILFLIRHGESLGQIAGTSRRRNDRTLVDCGLSNNGIQQAIKLPKQFQQQLQEQQENHDEDIQNIYDTIDIIYSSPLTRAIQTAILGFPNKPIVIQYDLREIGTSCLPENIPRSMEQVLHDVHIVNTMKLSYTPPDRQYDAAAVVDAQQQQETEKEKQPLLYLYKNIDFITYQPSSTIHSNIGSSIGIWPKGHDRVPNVVRKDKIRQFLYEIGQNHTEQIIAIVCHYHVIRTILSNPTLVTPQKKKKQVRNYHHHTNIDNHNTRTNNNNNNNTEIVAITTPGKQQQQQKSTTKSTTTLPLHQIHDLHPQNAIPIKCYLDTQTGVVTLA